MEESLEAPDKGDPLALALRGLPNHLELPAYCAWYASARRPGPTHRFDAWGRIAARALAPNHDVPPRAVGGAARDRRAASCIEPQTLDGLLRRDRAPPRGGGRKRFDQALTLRAHQRAGTTPRTRSSCSRSRSASGRRPRTAPATACTTRSSRPRPARTAATTTRSARTSARAARPSGTSSPPATAQVAGASSPACARVPDDRVAAAPPHGRLRHDAAALRRREARRRRGADRAEDRRRARRRAAASTPTP